MRHAACPKGTGRGTPSGPSRRIASHGRCSCQGPSAARYRLPASGGRFAYGIPDAPGRASECDVEHVSAPSEPASLRVRAARGAAALAVGSLLGQAIALATSLVLARLLSPADFGLVA